MKKITFVLCLSLIVWLVSCQNKTTEKAYGIIDIQINPSITIVVDANYKVVSFMPANDDAEILLSDMDIIGLDDEEAVEQIIEEAYKSGFLDVMSEENIIELFATHEKDENYHQDLFANIKTFIENDNLPFALLDPLERLDMDEETYLNQLYTQLSNDMTVTDPSINDLQGVIQSVYDTYKDLPKVEEIQIKKDLVESEAIVISEFEEMERDPITYMMLDAHAAFNYETIVQQMEERSSDKLDYVEAKRNEQMESYLAGNYTFELSTQELTYFVNYHTIDLNSDGTYLQRLSYTSKVANQTTSQDSTGTWQILDGVLVLTNTGGFNEYFSISSNRLYKEEVSGSKIFFVKVS